MAMAAAGSTGHRQWQGPNLTQQLPPSKRILRLANRSIARTPKRSTEPWKHIAIAKLPSPPAPVAARPSQPNAVTYTSSISTDIPVYEPPGVSFDEYLRDRARVFRAMFPDQSRSERLNDEEWRIQMLPLQFLLLTVDPVVVMRLQCRSPNSDASVLDLRATGWELRGLDRSHMPSDFDLSVHGSLYVDRSGSRGHGRLRGHLEISISSVLPPALTFVPENILRGVAESVLRRLAEKMKHDVDVGLITDFQKFRREKIMQRGAHASEIAASILNVAGD